MKIDPNLVFVSTAMIFMMQAGFALLESGQARAKNSVNVIMKNYCDMCFGAIVFWAFGYAWMHGYNPTGYLGITGYLAIDLSNQDFLHLLFQLMFAATAATIVSGAVAERTKFWGYILMSMWVSGVVYPIFGSWVWGGWHGGKGWLTQLGFHDFAGSAVVHAVGGWSALAALIVIKPRLGRYSTDGESRLIQGHNLTSVALGGFLLWFGWFGFNGGSLLTSSDLIGRVVLNTHLAGTASVCTTLLWLTIRGEPILLTTVVNCGLGGLVAITGSADIMPPVFAIAIGAIAGVLVTESAKLIGELQLDDVVGAVSVHAICGSWGILAIGLFQPSAGFNPNILFVQCIGLLTAFAWAFFVSLIGYSVINKLYGLRVSTKSEQRGLDFEEHYEVSYPEFQQQALHQGKR